MIKPAPRIDLPELALTKRSAEPLHLQIYRQLRAAVLDGALRAGIIRLPSTRSLAEDLGVSRTTVLAAYDQLLSEGYVEGRVGSGTRIAPHLPDELRQAPARRRPVAPAYIAGDDQVDH